MANKPKVSFLLPIRMFQEDKEFLGINLVKKVNTFLLPDDLPSLRMVQTYYIKTEVNAYKPIELNITKTLLGKMLKPVFPNGKLIDYESFFVQSKSRTMLPIVNVEIYY